MNEDLTREDVDLILEELAEDEAVEQAMIEEYDKLYNEPR